MKKSILLFVGVIAICITHAQSIKPEVIAAAGDFYKNDNYSMSWTMGECVTETFSSAQNTLTQGFQQSSYTITAINRLTTADITVNAFPNPVIDYITIQVKAADGSQPCYSFELFDVEGKLLLNQKLEENSRQFDMSVYRNGTYLLRVYNPEKNMIQNFKILKN
jgi:hypothetical protein